MKKKAHLVLADGASFDGYLLAETSDVRCGEIVFSTSTSGYIETISDPSFFGQIVVLANPEIGNYGVALEDLQSNGAKCAAVVVRNFSMISSSHRSDMTLADWLLREGIPLFYGADTRALIRHIRDAGSMNASLGAQKNWSKGELYQRAKNFWSMDGQKLSQHVSVQNIQEFKWASESNQIAFDEEIKIVVMDFGVKRAILRDLASLGAKVIVAPGSTSYEEIWALNPDALFLSNGPGDPKMETGAVKTLKAMIGKLPIFGVCLGHQILAQALGLSTYKLKFGHRGSNQPVKCPDGRIMITAQNHGFAVNSSTDSTQILSEYNISDQSNEGLSMPEKMAFSVQFHPEGAPGPNDAKFYFKKFVDSVKEWKKSRGQLGLVGDRAQASL